MKMKSEEQPNPLLPLTLKKPGRKLAGSAPSPRLEAFSDLHQPVPELRAPKYECVCGVGDKR